MRTPEELERIREANRRAMGLAGVDPVFAGRVSSGSISDAILAGLGPLRVRSAFPQVDYAWDPSQPSEQPQGGGTPVGDWLNKHVFRPEVEWGGVRYAPGDGAADYSWVARIVAWASAAAAAGGIAWVLVRAFTGGRRANPRARGARTSVRYYVLPGRRRAA